jgi:hypothetical protein
VAIGSDGLPAASPLADYGLPALGVVWDWLLRGTALLGLAWVLGGRPSAGAMFRMSGWTLIPDIARLGVMLAVMLGTGQVPARGLEGFAPAVGGPVVNVVDAQNAEGDGAGGDTGPGDVYTFEAGPGSVDMGPGGLPGAGDMYVSFLRNSFLSAIDLYSLWALVLLAIGAAVTARLGWLKAALSSLLYFGLNVALAALPPLLSFWLLRFAGGGGPAIIR